MLNTIWPIFIIISLVYGIFTGKITEINDSIFNSSKDAVNLCITLLGTICLWNGIMQIAINTKIVEHLKKLISPLMRVLFPNINKKDEAYSEISMNMVTNVIGLGNAATPIGLKAMKTLQRQNNKKDSLSDNMFMFIVVNTASLQIIPTTVIALRNSLRITKSRRSYYCGLGSNCLCFFSSNNICKNNYEKWKEK